MRVRFAPSPTGALHVGGARTALYNWLLAHGPGDGPQGRAGTLVLRIEDTDRARSTPENVEQIFDALRWLNLDWDEGPIFQSERADRHQQALAQLLDAGHAYRSSATGDDVKAFKAANGADRGFRGEPEADGAVRLHVPDEGHTVVHDVIHGDTAFPNASLDDPVIARADGSVLYNFAVAIDDLDAEISHVVRGADHLSNTPKQLLVLEALGAPSPVYAHLPLLHGPDGRKLSKRHGAASVQELRDAGYLPEAVDNYIALLGAGFAADEEFFTLQQLADRFRLERVSKSPAVFDEKKLRSLDGDHLRALQRRRADPAPGDLHRPHRPAWRGRDLTGEDPDAGGLLAAGVVPVRRAGRRPGGVRSRDRIRRWRRHAARRPRGAGGRASRSTPTRFRRRCAASSSSAESSPARCFSRCGWRSPARRSRRASSSRSRCWDATQTLARIDAALARAERSRRVDLTCV